MAAGKEIERLRKLHANRLSVAKAASLIGVDSERLRKWEQRDVDPSDNAAQQAGIETHVHFHQARHTFAYLSKQKNVSTDVIKDALGHSNYATTKGYLKSLSDDHINDALRDVYQ